MWDFLDNAAQDVSDFFGGNSDASSAASGAASEIGGADNIDGPLTNVTAGEIAPVANLSQAELNNPDGFLGTGGQQAGQSGSDFGWATVGSALKSAAGALNGIGSPKSAGQSGFVLKTTELPGQSRAMGYETPNSPYPGKATTSVDPRQVNQYWYNLMKQFAYTGNK